MGVAITGPSGDYFISFCRRVHHFEVCNGSKRLGESIVLSVLPKRRHPSISSCLEFVRPVDVCTASDCVCALGLSVAARRVRGQGAAPGVRMFS